jgi:formyl-CoA transferase/CoA:oxalate CoA-transferase
LDLTRLLPGALVTRSLARFGAEVWKVEAPGHDDYARNMPPLINRKGAYFWLTNSGKKSIVLDLKHEEGMQVFLHLVSKADVLIEAFDRE